VNGELAEAIDYSQWVTGEYWDEYKIAAKHRPEIPKTDKSKVDVLRTGYIFSPLPALRWNTVRDAIWDLPDPRDKGKAIYVPNHEFRNGASV